MATGRSKTPSKTDLLSWRTKVIVRAFERNVTPSDVVHICEVRRVQRPMARWFGTSNIRGRGSTPPEKFNHFPFQKVVKNIKFRPRPARCSCRLWVLSCLNKHSKLWTCVLKVLSQCLNNRIQVEIPLGNIPRLRLTSTCSERHYLRHALYCAWCANASVSCSRLKSLPRSTFLT